MAVGIIGTYGLVGRKGIDDHGNGVVVNVAEIGGKIVYGYDSPGDRGPRITGQSLLYQKKPFPSQAAVFRMVQASLLEPVPPVGKFRKEAVYGDLQTSRKDVQCGRDVGRFKGSSFLVDQVREAESQLTQHPVYFYQFRYFPAFIVQALSSLLLLVVVIPFNHRENVAHGFQPEVCLRSFPVFCRFGIRHRFFRPSAIIFLP